MRKLFPVILLLAGLTTSFAGPYDTWAKYREITVNTTATAGGANIATAQNNFPLLVRLDSVGAATGADVLTGSLTAGGLDVRFTDSTGQTALSFERERWTSSAAEFWVKVPVVAGSGSTKVRMYWGKTAQTTASAPAAVFDTATNFSAVWHMNGADSTAGELDATANGLNASAMGRPGALNTGGIGYSRTLDTNAASVTAVTATGLSITPNALYFSDVKTGWAVGAGGVILKTVNGGANWTAQTSGTTKALRGVFFAGPTLGIAVGDSGTIRKTTNGGTNWTAATSGTGQNLNAVAFGLNSTAVAIAVGDSGTTLRTADTGATWAATVTASAPTTNFTGIAFENANNGFAVGDSSGRGIVRRITLLNTTPAWAGVTGAGIPALRSIAWATNGTNYIAVGDSGFIRRSTSGTAWASIGTNPALGTNLKSVHCQGICYAVGDSGKIYQGSNQGQLWNLLTTPATVNTLTAVSRFYAVGAGATVRKIEDARFFVVDGSAFHPATNFAIAAKSTLSAWVNSSVTNANHVIISKSDYHYTLQANGNAAWEGVEYDNVGWRGAASANNAVTVGWTYVAFARDSAGTAARMYVNGVLQTAAPSSASTTYNRGIPRDLWIGRAQDATGAGGGTTRLWRGALDEVRVSNTNRSADWVMLEFQTQKSGVTAVTLGASISTTGAPIISFTPSTVVDTTTKAASHVPASTGGAIVSCTVSPTLPAGLGINATTCAITGTPTAVAAAQAYKVKATNGTGSDSVNLTLSVVIPRPTVVFNPATVVDTTTKAATHTPVTTGTITTCTVSPTLPAGLGINATTCVISGTPTANATAQAYKVKATNSTGSDSVNLTLSVITVTGIRPGAFVFRVSGEKPYSFTLPAAAVASTEKIRLRIADAYGRTVWEKTVNPSRDGTREISWNGMTASGLRVSNGMYVVRLSILSGGVETEFVDKTVNLAP